MGDLYVESQKAKIFRNLKQLLGMISSIEKTLIDLPEEEEEFRMGPIGIEQVSKEGWHEGMDSRVISIYFGGVKILDIPTIGRGEELSLQMGLKDITAVKSLVDQEFHYVLPRAERKERIDVRLWRASHILFEEELNPLAGIGAIWFMIFGGLREGRAREIIARWGLPFSIEDRDLFLRRNGRVYPKTSILRELGVRFEVVVEEEGLIKRVFARIKGKEPKKVIIAPEKYFVDGFEEIEPVYNPKEELGTLLILTQEGCPYSDRVIDYITPEFRDLALERGIRIRRCHAYNQTMVGVLIEGLSMKQTPTFLALNEYLEEFDRREGYMSPQTLMRWIRDLGDRLKWRRRRKGALY